MSTDALTVPVRGGRWKHQPRATASTPSMWQKLLHGVRGGLGRGRWRPGRPRRRGRRYWSQRRVHLFNCGGSGDCEFGGWARGRGCEYTGRHATQDRPRSLTTDSEADALTYEEMLLGPRRAPRESGLGQELPEYTLGRGPADTRRLEHHRHKGYAVTRALQSRVAERSLRQFVIRRGCKALARGATKQFTAVGRGHSGI